MAKKEYNKSFSARVRRRNAQGFAGIGTGKMVDKDGTVLGYNTSKLKRGGFGNYNDETQNHKDVDYALDRARKNRLGFVANSIKITEKGPVFVGHKSRCMSKKYANNIQTARGAHRRVSQ